jgi:hypothetical protein
MPEIKTKRVVVEELEQVLQDILNTEPNKWNKFFVPDRINEIFSKLTNQIQTKNFFISDYSINTFIDFLKVYAESKFKKEELNKINKATLIAFDRVCMALQTKIITHTGGLNESQQLSIGNYLAFLRQLMEHQYRDLFDKTEITLSPNNLKTIRAMLHHNSAFINDDLVEKYISILRLSFDVPKFLANYELGLGINPFAEACFLNKNINIHIVSTKFFDLLGYHGKLLDYYKDNPKFNISARLLVEATHHLKQNALNLQQYFFDHLNQSDDIDKPLLQHYLYVHFFGVIYKKYPERLEALKTDRDLSRYIKLDYVALPNSLDCQYYFLADNKVIIEYKNLSTNIPEIACQAIHCSSKSYEQWQRSLGFHVKTKSRYIFRVGDSHEKYTFTYAYGERPSGGGFYLSGDVKNDTVTGVAYSYFDNVHQFTDVSRHEMVHHANFILYLTAVESNSGIAYFINRNFNEGLAVLFAGGACAPGYSSQNFNNTTAPSVETLLNSEYIGYSTSWLYNNYFIQQYPSFYQELLSLGKDEFKDRWTPILNRDQQHFFNWLPYLKQVCQDAPKELGIEDCPSIYLKDYQPRSVTKPVTTTEHLRSSTESVPGLLTTNTLNLGEMEISLILAIYNNDITSFGKLLQSGANPNFRDKHTGNTPLHFLYLYANCDIRYLASLRNYGAKITANNEGILPYAIAEERCNATQLQVIKSILDTFDATISKPETGLSAYELKTYPLLLSLAIPVSATTNGFLSALWDQIAEKFPRLANIIFYVLKPGSVAMINSMMNILFYRRLSYISSEDAVVFCYYLGMNYLGMLSNQLGKKATKNIQNTYSKFFLQYLLNTFFTNPSLLSHLVYERFELETFQLVLWPMLSMLFNGFLFQAGEWIEQKLTKKVSYFFKTTPISNASSTETTELLSSFEICFADLKTYFKQVKSKDYYEIFEKDLKSFPELPEGIEALEPSAFNDFSGKLKKIIENLEALQPKKDKKIKTLLAMARKTNAALNSLRPCPQLDSIKNVHLC